MKTVFTSPEIGTANMDLDKRLWCGPAAVSAITGQPVSIVHSLIQKYRLNQGHKKNERCITHISATYKEDLHYVFKKFSYTLRPFRSYFANDGSDLRKSDLPTLRQWLDNRSDKAFEKTFLVHITGHWCLIKGDYYYDNHLQKPVKINKAPRRKTRVLYVYEILKREKLS